jgi:hypothetical protein
MPVPHNNNTIKISGSHGAEDDDVLLGSGAE